MISARAIHPQPPAQAAGRCAQNRSVVRGGLLIDDRPAIVESILALARTLKTNVVAEGIERRQQAVDWNARLPAGTGLLLLASCSASKIEEIRWPRPRPSAASGRVRSLIQAVKREIA
jgi:hypothetical protein